MAQSFKMLVQSGDNPTLYDEKLVSKVNGEPKAGYVFTIYARLSNMDDLSKANTVEVRERCLLMNKEDETGAVVVVHLNKVNDAGYYMTTKLIHKNATTIEQVHVPISETSYSHLGRVAHNRIPFTRHKFPCANSDLDWEIDVFKAASGSSHPWVKIDLEVKDLDDPVPPLPLTCDEYFLDFPGIVTNEQKAFVNRLWTRDWLSLDTEWVQGRFDFKQNNIIGTP